MMMKKLEPPPGETRRGREETMMPPSKLALEWRAAALEIESLISAQVGLDKISSYITFEKRGTIDNLITTGKYEREMSDDLKEEDCFLIVDCSWPEGGRLVQCRRHARFYFDPQLFLMNYLLSIPLDVGTGKPKHLLLPLSLGIKELE